MIYIKTCYKNQTIEYNKCNTTDLACEIALNDSKKADVEKMQVCIFGFVEYEFKNGQEVEVTY